jgi:hypothetical protein
MRPAQIEYWALEIIDRVSSSQPIEDSRVELKAGWIEPQKAARQIAGHANAARGEPILWLIGVHEDNGVIGAAREELANWYPAVQSEFDGIAPSVTDLNIQIDEKTVVALLFETDRAPYVVKNPLFGTKGVVVSREVPWREGTRTRSARRSDLIKLLVPILSLPEIEVLGGKLTVHEQEEKWRWLLKLDVYMTPQIGAVCTIPFHQCGISFEVFDLVPLTELKRIKIHPPYRSLPDSELDSLTIAHTQNEVIVQGPGRLYIRGETSTEYRRVSYDRSIARVNARLVPTHVNGAIHISEELSWRTPEGHRTGIWLIDMAS